MIVDQHEVRVFSGSVELKAVENAGTITADRGWSPHVQGRITVAAPTDDSLTAPGTLLTIELVQRFGDVGVVRDLTDLWCGPGRTLADLTAEVCGPGRTLADLTAELITANSWNTPVRPATGRTFYLLVTERTRKRGEHTLQLASIEALMQDWLWYAVDVNLEGQSLTIEATTPSEFLNMLDREHRLAHFSPPFYNGFETDRLISPIVPYNLVASPVRITPTSHTIATGEGTTARLYDLLNQGRQRLYSPGETRLQLVDYPYTAPGEITVEPAVNLIDWEITDDRPRMLLVRYTGTASNPSARPVYWSDPEEFAGTRYSEEWPPERIVDAPHAPIITSNPGVGEVEPYLERIGLDESPLKLRTINDYSVMPGSPITYTLPDESEETDSIDAITWQLGGRWEMDIWV